MDTWVLPAMLGLGLAAASGMRTFLPLLMLSAAVHFELFGITVGESMSGSDRPVPWSRWR
jgi:hypothetical protein